MGMIATRNAIAETYEDVKPLIYQQVHHVIRNYGGRFDERLSEAHLAFMHACRDYDRSRGRFETCLKWYIWKSLITNTRSSLKKLKGHTREPMDMTLIGVTKSSFVDVLDSLSPDAVVVVELLFDHSEDVLGNDTRRQTPFRTRQALRKFLLNLGWADSRIKKAFNSISTALQGA